MVTRTRGLIVAGGWVDNAGMSTERVLLRIDGRGALSLSEGRPFLMVADTAWSGLIRSTAGDWRDYLRMRKEQGFNAVLTVLTAPWRGAAVDAWGESSFGNDGRINAGFYERMEEKFAAADEAGMTLLPVLVWACTASDPGQAWPEEKCVEAARYGVERMGWFKNVMWLLGGDGNYGKAPERWVRMGRAVFGDRTDALVGMHHGGLMLPDAALLAEPWCKFHGVQSGHGDGEQDLAWLQEVLPAWREGAKHVAVANVEPNYEHHPAYRSQMMFTGRHVRRAAWWSMLRMASCGVGYGHNSVWNWNVVAEGAVGHDSITRVVGKLPPWRDVMDLPGARSMGVLRKFFEEREWAALRPAQELVGAQDRAREKFVAAAEIGDEAVLYKPALAGVTLSDEAMGRYRRMQWFDPARGVYGEEQAMVRETKEGDLRDDGVLILRR